MTNATYAEEYSLHDISVIHATQDQFIGIFLGWSLIECFQTAGTLLDNIF